MRMKPFRMVAGHDMRWATLNGSGYRVPADSKQAKLGIVCFNCGVWTAHRDAVALVAQYEAAQTLPQCRDFQMDLFGFDIFEGRRNVLNAPRHTNIRRKK